jgi:pimeloyl-ACP methyl ester carboxylesterase
MLDEPYIGRKTHDVLSVLDFLRSSGCEEVHLVGVGWGAVSAAFAGLLDDSVKQVTLKNAFTSYAAVAESVTYKMPVSLMPFGVLERFDLPDVYAALSSKKLRQIEPWNERAEAVSS